MKTNGTKNAVWIHLWNTHCYVLGNESNIYSKRLKRYYFLNLGNSYRIIGRNPDLPGLVHPAKKWKTLSNFKTKYMLWQMVAGLTGGLGILSRNIALETTRVAIVLGLVQISALFTLLLSPLLLGKADKEQITPKLIFGILFVIGGSVLIIYGRNL